MEEQRTPSSTMTPKDIVQYASSAIISRKECLELSLDRGLREGMQIEKWILTEMLAKLIQLKKDGFVDRVEGEHKYPRPKTRLYEHCDLWWQVSDEEHWLEVKTLIVPHAQQNGSLREKPQSQKESPDLKAQQIGSLQEVTKDLEKRHQLRSTDIFHHLVIVFHIEPAEQGFLDLKAQLGNTYGELMTFESDWDYPVWPKRSLHMSLHTLVRG